MGYDYNEAELNKPVSYYNLLEFFDSVGRRKGCPVCPHTGNWNFHVDGLTLDQGDPKMVFFDIPQRFSVNQSEGRFMRTVSLECPQCGHLEFIQAAKVLQFLEAKAHRARKDGEDE